MSEEKEINVGGQAIIEGVMMRSPERIAVAVRRPDGKILLKNNLMEDVMKNVVTFGTSATKMANIVSLNKVDAVIGWRVFHHWNPSRMDYIKISPEKSTRSSSTRTPIPSRL